VERRGDGALLAARLRERLPELEATIATRAYAISDPRQVPDPAYLQGFAAALPAALEYALAALELGERRLPEMPVALLAHARLAARDGVAVDTVMRQYFAANGLFADFLAAEAERAEVDGPALRRLLGTQATLFDRLLAALSEEYAREARNRPANVGERRRECVKRLLAGELVDSSELGYDLEARHLGVMAKGEGAQELMRELASRLDRNLLAVCREEEPLWACWLGGRRPLAAERVVRAATEIGPGRLVLTVGEPAAGLAGWRLSHRQAKAMLPLAERAGAPVLRYAEAAVLAAVLGDELAAESLRRLYLEPLEASRDGGAAARETLRAYFAAARNVSSTAAALGVDRRTVRNRIGAIEQLIGRPIGAAATDLELALRLDSLSPERRPS
jgi:hypothetical protein